MKRQSILVVQNDVYRKSMIRKNRLKKFIVICVVGLTLMNLVPCTEANWTTLEAPGADSTNAYGIDGDNIVGQYHDAAGHHGFIYDGTTWTTLDAPGAHSTLAYGIDGSNIVGDYWDATGCHGFLYDGTTWTTLDVPGADSTTAYGIDGDNIVGLYHEKAGGDQGFLYDGKTWSTLNAPGPGGTYLRGIDRDNIVGYKYPHSFLYNGTSWSTLNAPGTDSTRVSGIDGDNIVGNYVVDTIVHGFLFNGTTWTTLEVPGADVTFLCDIDGDNIVGYYYNEGTMDVYGFLYTTNKGPVASFTYLPQKPMVGGRIDFDASNSEGNIVDYKWDFDDGPPENYSVPEVSHIFKDPKIYDVNLTVTDVNGLTDSNEVKLNLSLTNGDLLLLRGPKNPFAKLGFCYWTHIGIYHQASNRVIEVKPFPWGIHSYPLSDWFFPEVKCAEVIRVKTDQATRDAAVGFAMDRLGWLGFDLYSILKDLKQDGTKLTNLDFIWYCSELVWAAYYSASKKQINLDPDDYAVSPDEINNSNHTEFRAAHMEDIPDIPETPYFWGQANCPVDLEITDPSGLILNKQGSQIPEAIYQEFDIDGEGALDDFFAIPEPKEGDYLIYVIPEPDASPTDTFTLVVSRDETDRVLGQDVQVQDISVIPYVVTGLDSIGVDVEIEPETLNLSSEGNWITSYLWFPKVYYAYNVDPDTILLNGEIGPVRLFVGDEEDIEQILMVKFDRSNLQKIIQPGNVELIVTGELLDGTPFECRDTIRVIE